MTTLICDFQSIVGKKINGTATLTSGRVRPAYSAPSVIVHDPVDKAVVDGRATFTNVNPGEAVITVDWEDQSATLRFEVPESDEDIYLSDCLTGDYFTPEEIDLLRWGIKEQISGARELIETAANAGKSEITESISDYFSQAAETIRQTVEAAERAEDALDQISEKVGAVEGTVTTVDELQGITADALARMQALQDQLGDTDTDLAEIVRELNAITPTIHDAATQAALAVQEAQSAASELLNLQEATSTENARLNDEIEAANQEISQTMTDLAGLNTRIGNEVSGILEEVSRAMDKANQGVEDARIANDHLHTMQMQMATIQVDQYEIYTQQQTIQSDFDARMAEIDAVQTDLDAATSKLSSLTESHSQLTQDMTNKVSALQTLTQTHSGELVTVKQVADKGVADAAAAKRAADQAASDAESLAAAAQAAAEKYAKEKSEADKAAAEAAAATEALRVAKAEANAAKTAAASDAKAKADAAEKAAKLHAEAQAKAAKEAAEATAAQDAATKAENARIAAEANAKVLSDKAQQAADTAQTSIDNLEIGGRNLLRNSANWRYISSDSATTIDRTTPGKLTVLQEGSWNAYEWTTPSWMNAETFFDGKSTYTFSVELRVTSPGGGTARISFDVREGGSVRRIVYGEDVGDTEGDWIKSTATMTLPNKGEHRSLLLIRGTGTAPGDVIEYRNAKLERGNKATDWTPAPEDIDSAVSAAQTAADEAKADAVNKAAAAQLAAEQYAKEKSEADKAAVETAAAAEALRVAKAEAAAAKTAAATDAQTKAAAAEAAAKTYAAAQAKAAKEAAEATAAADAKAKADAAKIAAEGTAKTLADAAQAAAESKSKADLDSLEIGGRNLAEKSVNVVDRLGSPTGSRREYSNFDMGTPYASVPEGVDITISFDLEMEFNHATVRTLQVYCSNRRGPKGFLARTLTFGDIPQGETFKGRVYVNTKSTIPTSQTNDTCFVEFYSIYNTDNWYKVTNLKVERGTKATDWTPAPEDVDAGIATAQSTADTARTEAVNKANQALQDATEALTNYQKVNDPKVSTAQSAASEAKSAADNARAEADKANNLLTVQDTRNTDELPHYYWTNYKKTTAIEFKSAESLGLTGGYGTLTTVVPWHDSSGGSIQQTFVVNNGGATYKRRSRGSRTDATWGDWVNELAELNSQISTLNSKAGELTTGLSKAATQEQYNELNTRLWGGQGEINKLQGEINDNNTAFQNWQTEINNRRDIWEDAHTKATQALARFAITQSQWNTLSSTATNANTKAIASHAALFEGQNKWNEVATAAIAAQATLQQKQDLWNAAQEEVNDNQRRWNDAAKEILDSTGKFQALQTQFNSDQKKWNATQALVNDTQKGINALNNKTNTAQNDATKALRQIVNTIYPDTDVITMDPDTGQPDWTTHSAITGPHTDAATGKVYYRAAGRENTNTSRVVKPTPDAWYVLSFEARANKSGSRIYIQLMNEENKGILMREVEASQWVTSSSLNSYPIDNQELVTWWREYRVRFKIEEGWDTLKLGTIYWNHPNGTVTDAQQWISNLRFYRDIPTQESVDKAQNDALAALNRFSINQSQWNAVSTTATNANTAAVAAKAALDAYQNRWIQGADLAINNLQTSSTKFKQWTKAATDAIAAIEKADAAQDNAINALTEIIGVEGDNGQEGSLTHRISQLEMSIPSQLADLEGLISNNTRMVWHKHQWVRTNNLNIPNKAYFSVSGNTYQVTITAVGSWIGQFMLSAVTNKGATLMDWREVTATSREWTINASSLDGNWERLMLDFSITPGVAVNLTQKSTGKQALTAGAYRVLWQHTVPVATTINASLNVGWHAATFDYKYGIRIRAGSNTILAEDGPRTGVGPRTPLGNGYRNMSRSVSKRSVAAGTVIYFEASVSSGGADQRTVRDFTANINYIR